MADCYDDLEPSTTSIPQDLVPTQRKSEEKRQEENGSPAGQTHEEMLLVLEERDKEVVKLRQQLSEILRINHHWDSEYKELKLLYDDLLAKHIPQDNETIIQNENKLLHEQLKHVRNEREKIDRKFTELKSKYDHLKKQYTELMTQFKQQRKTPSPPPTHSTNTVSKLQENIMILNTQLQTYQEDYHAEKRDKEKVIREKETDSLRYEAEIASLKIQLDRATSELVRYKGEAVILGQQLRLKQQREEEEYRRHLESQGYSSRKPLPPLDPFVEKDVRTIYFSHSDPSITPPLSSPTAPPTRRLSLGGYQTHLNETRPQYETRPQQYNETRPQQYTETRPHEPRPYAELTRRTSIPSIRPNTIDLTTPTSTRSSGDLRSVSPQIHRIGNLRLYSRESDPELNSPNITNNLDTFSEGAIERRVQADLKTLNSNSLNDGSLFLEERETVSRSTELNTS